MSPTVAARDLTTPDKVLVTPRPKPAKADLHDNAGHNVLSDVVSEAAKRAYGKQGAAAAQLGKDEGNFSRDVRAERTTLRELRALGPAFLAAFGKELVLQFGELDDPKARARRLCDEAQELINELRQFVDAA